MPGWPSVGRADDRRLAEALRRAEGQATATLYDTYAERLHAYAHSLLGDRESAGQAVHDALVAARGHAGQLRDAGRLRAWLYALTRFQAVARARSRPSAPPALAASADPELAEAVGAALGEQGGSERETLELFVRHGLTAVEVGSVLGLTPRQAESRLARARDRLENAAAAVLLARSGRAHCPGLSAVLDSWTGPLTPALRHRVSCHVGGCELCGEGRRRLVSAATLLDLAPVAAPPAALRRRVIDTSAGAEHERTRTLIFERTEEFDRAGFPVAVERAGRRQLALLPVLVAAVCVLTGTGAAALLGRGEETRQSATRLAPSPSPLALDAVPTVGAAPSDGPVTSAPPVERESPSASAGRPRERADPPGRRARRPAPTARLSVVCPRAVDGSAGIRLGAGGAAVVWRATASAGLGLARSGGRLAEGRRTMLTVSVASPDLPGRGTVTIRSNGGDAVCALSWAGERTPPTDGPETEQPSEGPPDSGPPSGSPQGSEITETDSSP